MPKIVKGVYNDGSLIMPYDRMLVGALAILFIAGFILYMKYSKPGRAMRALAQDRVAAQLMGVEVDRYTMIGFAMGAMLAGITGGLLVTITGINAGIGGPISINHNLCNLQVHWNNRSCLDSRDQRRCRYLGRQYTICF